MALPELVTILDVVRYTITQMARAEVFLGHGTDNYWDEALQLVLGALEIPPQSEAKILDARLTAAEKTHLAALIERRVVGRVPTPYLIKKAYFAGLCFYIDERALIPRSPIAELIEEGFSPWVEVPQVLRILDMCTGSGCLAITLSEVFPEALVHAVDLSADALAVAAINVDRFGLQDKVQCIQSDLFAALPSEPYDIIVSNPPYLSGEIYQGLPEEYGHEPKQALWAAEQGLALVVRLLREAANYLNPKGILVVEVGEAQPALEARFPRVPFTWLQFERGGEGVFLLTAEELRESASDFAE